MKFNEFVWQLSNLFWTFDFPVFVNLDLNCTSFIFNVWAIRFSSLRTNLTFQSFDNLFVFFRLLFVQSAVFFQFVHFLFLLIFVNFLSLLCFASFVCFNKFFLFENNLINFKADHFYFIGLISCQYKTTFLFHIIDSTFFHGKVRWHFLLVLLWKHFLYFDASIAKNEIIIISLSCFCIFLDWEDILW